MIGVYLLFLVHVSLFSAMSAYANPQVITLKEALDRGESTHPALKASVAREAQARSAIDERESAYYPHLSLEAIDSTGFSGSTGAMGVTGLMGSPFRSGIAYGAVVTQDIWDFGRTTNQVKESRALAEGEAERSRIDRYELDDQVILAYFDCALSVAQADTWGEIARAAHLVTSEVDRFVHTGQRSIVDGYISRTQEQAAIANQAGFRKRAEVAAQRLGVIIGSTGVGCPSLSEMNMDSGFGFVSSGTPNPYIEIERRQTDAARAKLSAAKSDYLPKLVGIASAGQMEDAKLVTKKNYSLGVGVILPLFEGFSTKSQVDQAAALVDEHEYRMQAATVGVDSLNARYDEGILSSQAQFTQLAAEVTLAQKAFDTAKQRYFNLQGTLTDVRDSLNDLSRVLTQRNAILGTYLSELSQKQILNGAR